MHAEVLIQYIKWIPQGIKDYSSHRNLIAEMLPHSQPLFNSFSPLEALNNMLSYTARALSPTILLLLLLGSASVVSYKVDKQVLDTIYQLPITEDGSLVLLYQPPTFKYRDFSPLCLYIIYNF